MAKPYKLLREKMSSESQKRAEARTHEMLEELPLYELRQARLLSQEDIAKKLNVNQTAISKMERRTDMFISSLRNYIEAMGGTLEITARFPEGNITISQFEKISDL